MTTATRSSWARLTVDPSLATLHRSRGFWGDTTLGDHVAGHAARIPEQAAFVSEHGRLGWADYDRAADRVATAIRSAGLERLDRVAVLLPDSAAVHVALIGAERAGVTAVGIGRRAGEREVEHLLGRTKARALITLDEHRGEDSEVMVGRLREAGIELDHHIVVPRFEADPTARITVDGDTVAQPGTVDPDRARAEALGPDELFLINSTSGTTGLPKCVMHTENHWLYFHQKAVENGDLSPSDVFFGAVPAPFGFGLWTSHFTPTVLGSTCVVAERFDAEQTLAWIEQERVSVIGCVSTQFVMMLNSPEMAERDLTSLRVMFTGGEAVPYERARAFEQRTGCTVLQFYGSNETGLLTGTTLRDSPERRLRTAGRLVPEMEVRLFQDGYEVPIPGTGQPACRGPATCLGYLDDPEANAELFTDDGWMLMADICTVDEDGYLSVTGRTSDIIIRGGKNISATQVEDEVNEHPDVMLAAAVAAPDEVFGERVCVYAEVVDGADLTLEGLVAFLEDRGVTREIFPEHLVVVDQLPRSSGGKVAKGRLREDLRDRMDAR